MKKLVMAVAMLAATAAMAGEYVTFELNPSKENSVGEQADAGSVTLGTTNGNWTVDGKAILTHDKVGGKVTNDAVARLMYTEGPFYARVGLGERVASTGDYSYYNYTLGAKVNITDKVGVSLDATHQKAFEAGHPESDTYKLLGTYALTKSDVVGASWNVTSGDTISHGVGIQYTRKFN